MNFIFKTAAGIATMWSLAAFAIAAILKLAPKTSGKAHPVTKLLVIAIVVIVLVPTFGWLRLEQERARIASVYQVRVTVLDPQSIPTDDAKVWCSVGGEPKRVMGGWQFDIPATTKPIDRRITVYSTVANNYLYGQADVLLGDDFHPGISIRLGHDQRAKVRGFVTDVSGHSLTGVRVSVVGYGNEAVSTGDDGNFVLPAHAADGEQIELHAEKKGYRPVSQGHPAGAHPAQIVLER